MLLSSLFLRELTTFSLNVTTSLLDFNLKMDVFSICGSMYWLNVDK